MLLLRSLVGAWYCKMLVSKKAIHELVLPRRPLAVYVIPFQAELDKNMTPNQDSWGGCVAGGTQVLKTFCVGEIGRLSHDWDCWLWLFVKTHHIFWFIINYIHGFGITWNIYQHANLYTTEILYIQVRFVGPQTSYSARSSSQRLSFNTFSKQVDSTNFQLPNWNG